MKSVLLSAALLLGFAISPSFAATPIGKVARLQGAAQGSVAGSTQDLQADAPVFVDEVIATSTDARVALAFDDGTTLTVGEKAQVTLDDFVYQPGGESRLHMAVVGAFRFVSGALAKGATREASVTTPVATIGVRGTDFWGGPIDGQFGVVLLEGAITVSTATGSVAVGDVGSGVDIGSGGATGSVEVWPQQKIDQAIASVTFR